jgi:hypothetical protein
MDAIWPAANAARASATVETIRSCDGYWAARVCTSSACWTTAVTAASPVNRHGT